MTNAKDVRCAHDLLDRLDLLMVLSEEQEKLLRSFLPELPKQKTLEEITEHVYDAWVGTEQSEWPDDVHGVLETWLAELHKHLQELEHNAKPAKPAHPEFLETEADYENAPDGTIVASPGDVPCHKYRSKWSSVAFIEKQDDKAMSRFRREVLRWGWGNE